jgi:hypothetical protein
MSKRRAMILGAWLVAAAHAGCSKVGAISEGALDAQAGPRVVDSGGGSTDAAGSIDAQGTTDSAGLADRAEPPDAAEPTDAEIDTDVALVDSGMSGLDAGTAGACTGDIVCDDFESSALGTNPADWQTVIDPPAAGTVLVDSTHAFSGVNAVHVTLAPASSIPHVQILREIALPTNAFFGRMMVWIAPYAREMPSHHWNLIEGWGYMPGAVTHTIYDQGMYEYGGVCSPEGLLGAAYLGPSTDCCQPSTAAVPTSGWSCIEWHFDGIQNEMQFWMDGQAVDSLTVTVPQCGGPWQAPVFERVDLGFGSGSPNYSTSHEMWIDDVAIDSNRIGCPAPSASTH